MVLILQQLLILGCLGCAAQAPDEGRQHEAQQMVFIFFILLLLQQAQMVWQLLGVAAQ